MTQRSTEVTYIFPPESSFTAFTEDVCDGVQARQEYPFFRRSATHVHPAMQKKYESGQRLVSTRYHVKDKSSINVGIISQNMRDTHNDSSVTHKSHSTEIVAKLRHAHKCSLQRNHVFPATLHFVQTKCSVYNLPSHTFRFFPTGVALERLGLSPGH